MVKDIILTFLTGGLWLIVVMIRNANARREMYKAQTEMLKDGKKMMGTYGDLLQVGMDLVKSNMEE